MTNGGGLARLASEEGIMIRQKLDIVEVFCPAFQKENKYKVGGMPKDRDHDDAGDWEDKTFKKSLKHNKLFTMKEKSECMDRICCGNRREFTMKVKAEGSDEAVAKFHRPFNCVSMLGPGFNCGQHIIAEDASGAEIGKTEYDFRCVENCCMNKTKFVVSDANGDKKYVIEDDLCCNANMFAPTLCCPARKMDIYNSDETEVVGSLTDYFPGCGARGCLGTADNFKLIFPKDADVKMRTQLMASVVLIDFLIFEKSENDNDGVGGDVA